MSKELIDKYGRRLNYLRLSVTDRCNFRCHYCMPEHGVQFAQRNELLSFDELYLLSKIFCNLGVTKIRITGGEPFVRNGIMPFLQKLTLIKGLNETTLTTNASLIAEHMNALKAAGILQINISLDSIDRQRFQSITRRNDFETVYSTVFKLLHEGFLIKLNCVVCGEDNIDDIIPLIELTKQHNLSVRFLEEMPFNGSSTFTSQWNYKQLYNYIQEHYCNINKLESPSDSTSINYKVEGYAGSFGIIPSFSRTFCGTCNRIRLSATGELRTCLYGAPVANLRNLLRDGASYNEIENEIIDAVSMRAKDGFEAEGMPKQSTNKSMSALGG